MQPIDKNFTPVEYDPQYILMVNQLKKYFPIKGGMVGKDDHRTHHPASVRGKDRRTGAV